MTTASCLTVAMARRGARTQFFRNSSAAPPPVMGWPHRRPFSGSCYVRELNCDRHQFAYHGTLSGSFLGRTSLLTHRSNRNGSNKFYTTSSAEVMKEERQRRVTIGLYRILLRQCRNFPNVHVSIDAKEANKINVEADGEAASSLAMGTSVTLETNENTLDAPILLQPQLEATEWGRQLLYAADIGDGEGHLFRFFRDWNIELDILNDEEREDFLEGDDESDSENEDEHDGVPMGDAYRRLLHASGIRTGVPLHKQTSIDEWYRAVTGSGPSTAVRFPTWTTARELQSAIREAFRADYRAAGAQSSQSVEDSSSDSSSDSDSSDEDGTTSDENEGKNSSSSSESDRQIAGGDGSSRKGGLPISVLHHWAIQANQLLREQGDIWQNVSVTTTGDIRVTATSRCIGHTSPTSSLPTTVIPDLLETKYRWAYRVRIENLSANEHVQLLGRYWHIQEGSRNSNGLSVTSSDNGGDDGNENDSERPPIIVNAPQTGAVGHLPVLKPGQCFEYMSGTDLATARGEMCGLFYMAKVPQGTKSARTGDIVADVDSENKLQVVVSPFPLVAPGN